MAINKIALDGTTLIDLSTDTVASSDDIVSGKVGHLNDGSVVTGTASGGDKPIYKNLNAAEGFYNMTDSCNIKQISNRAFACVSASGTNIVFNPASVVNSFFIVAKLLINQKRTSTRMIFGITSSNSKPPLPQMYFTSSHKIGCDCYNSSGVYFLGGYLNADVCETNAWYYTVYCYKEGKAGIWVLDDNYNVVGQSDMVNVASWLPNNSYGIGFGGAENNANYMAKDIFFSPVDCFIYADGAEVWGKKNQSVIDAVTDSLP